MFQFQMCCVQPCGEVQIIEEDKPLRAPRDAFGKLASLRNSYGCNISRAVPSNVSSPEHDKDSVNSEESFESELLPAERRMHQSAIDSYDRLEQSTSNDDERFESENKFMESHESDCDSMGSLHSDHGKKIQETLETASNAIAGKKSYKGEGSKICWKRFDLNKFREVPRAFLPYWVYRMFDAYCLAQRAAGTLFPITQQQVHCSNYTSSISLLLSTCFTVTFSLDSFKND